MRWAKVEQQVVETVKAVRNTLQMVDEDKADDVAEITSYIKDKANHIAIRRDVNEDKVEIALEVVKSEEISQYTPPEDLIDVASVLNGTPLRDLGGFLEREYIGIHHAAGGIGSTGSFILACTPSQHKSGSSIHEPLHQELVVLKQISINSPAEVFASHVMRAMRLRSPRFLALTSEQTKRLVDEKLRFARVTTIGPTATLFEPGFISAGSLLMEFEPGRTLVNASDNDLRAVDKHETLMDIGRCMAVDMVLNCFDRIPIVWDNDGNATNVMLAKDGLSVIDSAYTRVTDPNGAQNRIKKIQACVNEARSGRLGPHAEKVRSFFQCSTSGGLILSDSQMVLIMKGLGEACDELARGYEAIFHQASEETRRAFAEIIKGPGVTTQETLNECLDLGFCSACAEAML